MPSPRSSLGRSVVSVLVTFVVALVPFVLPARPAQAMTTSDNTSSPFWITTTAGDVWNFGGAANYGTLKGQPLNKPIVGITPTNDAAGYWLVASDGGIFSFGDATFMGSTGSIKLNQPIVNMTSTKSGHGYWMTASDGGIFAYGDAAFYGSTGSIHLNKPIVGMAATPTGKGYWLVASDGGIFAYGDAAFYGSTGGIVLQQKIVGMAPTTDGKGYWLLAADGGVFNYGDAGFYGSSGGSGTNSFEKIVPTTDGNGYWLVKNGGDAVGFGSAVTVNAQANGGHGGASSTSSNRPAVGLVFQINTPGDKAVAYSMDKLGMPYVWGGNGNPGYDCSGLTSQAWKSAGTGIPRVAADQYNFAQHVALDQLRPGDLLYWTTSAGDAKSIDHVGMYIGGGWGVNAGGTGVGVNVRNIVQTSGWMMNLGTRPAA